MAAPRRERHLRPKLTVFELSNISPILKFSQMVVFHNLTISNSQFASKFSNVGVSPILKFSHSHILRFSNSHPFCSLLSSSSMFLSFPRSILSMSSSSASDEGHNGKEYEFRDVPRRMFLKG